MSSREPPPDPVARLQVWPTVIEGLGLVRANLGALAKLALWPLLLTLAADLALTATFQGPLLYSLARVIVFNLIWVLFAVAWLRLLLLDDRQGVRIFPLLTRDHGRFTAYTLAIALFDLALTTGHHLLAGTAEDIFMPGPGYWLAFLAIAFLKLRFAFVYPAVAAGETYSLTLAWRHSAGAGLALFGAQVLVVFIPVTVLYYLFNEVAAQASVAMQISAWVLYAAVSWPFEAVYLALVAVAFRRCTGWVPPPDQGIVERFE